jgi:hypothetical protein
MTAGLQDNSYLCQSMNGADGISDIEGKVARVSSEGVGETTELQICGGKSFPKIGVYSCSFVVTIS